MKQVWRCPQGYMTPQKDHEDLRSNMIVLDIIKLFATGCNLMLKIAVPSLKKTKCILWFLDIVSTVWLFVVKIEISG